MALPRRLARLLLRVCARAANKSNATLQPSACAQPGEAPTPVAAKRFVASAGCATKRRGHAASLQPGVVQLAVVAKRFVARGGCDARWLCFGDAARFGCALPLLRWDPSTRSGDPFGRAALLRFVRVYHPLDTRPRPCYTPRCDGKPEPSSLNQGTPPLILVERRGSFSSPFGRAAL